MIVVFRGSLSAKELARLEHAEDNIDQDPIANQYTVGGRREMLGELLVQNLRNARAMAVRTV